MGVGVFHIILFVHLLDSFHNENLKSVKRLQIPINMDPALIECEAVLKEIKASLKSGAAY